MAVTAVTAAMRAGVAALAVVLAACSHGKSVESPNVDPAPTTPGDKLLAMLPPGAQVVIEIDLARLRANPAIGAVVTQALAVRANEDVPDPKDTKDPKSLGLGMPASPLAGADQIVLAAYGVGTAQAATLTVLAAPH